MEAWQEIKLHMIEWVNKANIYKAFIETTYKALKMARLKNKCPLRYQWKVATKAAKL